MTKSVRIGKISIGGGNKIAIQTMTNVDTANGELLLSEIKRLSTAGADLIRATVNNESAVKGFEYACKRTDVPLIADIHFDYKLAIKSVLAGASKVRINPGNTGTNFKELCSVCKDHGAAIRIGVNKGSLDKEIEEKFGRTAEGIVQSALKSIDMLEKYAFYDTVISLKSSNVSESISAYRSISKQTNYPLHVGITEAGGGDIAVMKSAIGIGSLLVDGIGDTIRVSLSDDPINEVYAAKNILRALKIDENYVEIISCPTCGRTEGDVIGISQRLRELTKDVKKRITIAVMGCVVNGLGEGKDADFGVAGGKEKSIIFEKGQKIAVVNNDEVEARLIELMQKY